MCGIAGIINFNGNSPSIKKIESMMDSMRYRGPDDEGVFIDKNIGLGFVRLSIIDLSSSGHQPMYSYDNKYVVVYNGEIFNYIELREELKNLGYTFKTQTDTEVLLNSYIEWGEKCLDRFNGMWAFAIYNCENESIFLARDRFGIKPLYYYVNKDFMAFASEIPPILKVIPVKPTANMQIIFDYLVFNRTDHSTETFFNGIYKLNHGHSMTLSMKTQNKITINKWYNLKNELNKVSRLINEDQFKNLLIDSIKIRLRSDVPIGVCLSGGLDSSTIVSVIVNEFNKRDIKTFSAIYQEGQVGNETEFINLFKTNLKNMYFTYPSDETLYEDIHKFIKIHAEPLPSTGPYAQYKVMELAHQKASVTLDGQGADELLAGYHYFFGIYFKELFNNLKLLRLVKEIYYYIKTHNSIYGIKTFIYFLLPSRLKSNIRIAEKKYLNKDFYKNYSKTNMVVDKLYNAKSINEAMINHIDYKLEHLLKWEDRNSMAFSIEARVPFLDHRLVESALKAQNHQIISKGMTKVLLRRSMIGILPEKIRLRTDKIGFDTPQDEWLKKRLFKDLVFSMLDSASFNNRKIINPKIAKKMYTEYLNDKIEISKEVWKWINLEFWFREYID